MNYFEGKTIWITGASSGMGEALVHQLSRLGANIIASANEPGELERVKSSCGEYSKNITVVPFDLSETGTIAELVNQQIERAGRIDFLINLGGISQRATIVETPLWLDRKIMEINYFGTIALSKAILPFMIRQGSGHILATSSISGRFGFPLRAAYSASKQALHGFIETLHIENMKNNVRGSVIIPGRVKTKISLRALTADGKEHGKMDPGQEKGISATRAAEMIIKGMKRNRREILVGGSELTMLYIRKFLPSLFFRLAGRIKTY